MSKKKFVIILVLIVLVCFGIGFFVAKSNAPQETTVPETSADVTETQSRTVESTSEKQTETTEESTEETTEESTTEAPKQSEVINTDCFSVVTPEDWYGEYSYSIRGYNDNGAYGLRLSHKDSVDAGNGGLVCVIEVHPVDEAYPEMMANSPMPYDHIGVIDVPDDNKYDVIVTYPSDVQFSSETEEGYLQLKDSVASVLDSLQVVDGAEFIEN